MADIISFPPIDPYLILEEFDRTGNPDLFLDAVEMIFERSGDIANLELRREAFIKQVFFEKDKRVSFDYLARTSEILARLHWAPKPPEYSSTGAIDPLLDAAIEAIKDIPRQEAALEEHAKAKGLSKFSVGLPWLELAQAVFGGDNPLRLIDEVLGAFCDAEQVAGKGCWFDDDETIHVSDENKRFLLARVLLPQLLRFLPEHDGDPVSRHLAPLLIATLPLFFLCDDFFQSEENSDNSELAGPLDAALAIAPESRHLEIQRCLSSGEGYVACLLAPGFLALPQGLFVAMLRRLSLKRVRDNDANLRLRILQYMLDRPIGVPCDWDSLMLEVGDPQHLANIRAAYLDGRDYPFLPIGMLCCLYGLLDHDEPESWPDNAASLMARYSEKIARYRRRIPQQAFPWEPEKTDFISAAVSQYLAGTASPNWDLFLPIVWAIHEMRSSGHEGVFDSPEHGFQTFQINRALWYAADRECLAELGNAFLSIYLLRKLFGIAQLNQAVDVDWPRFKPLINDCLARPRGEWVRQVLQHVGSLAQEKGWRIEAMRFRDLVGVAENVPTIPPKIFSVSEEALEKRVLFELRDEYPSVDKLCDRARDWLVDAEVRFEKRSIDLGRRGRQDHALETIAYAKPFEIELEDRLSSVINDASIQSYLATQIRNWRQSRALPTLGSYLTLLRHSVGMPDALRAMVLRAVGSLADNNSVLSSLAKIKGNRDPAAHSQTIAASQLIAQREIVFAEGLLRDFLELLPDRDASGDITQPSS